MVMVMTSNIDQGLLSSNLIDSRGNPLHVGDAVFWIDHEAKKAQLGVLVGEKKGMFFVTYRKWGYEITHVHKSTDLLGVATSFDVNLVEYL